MPVVNAQNALRAAFVGAVGMLSGCNPPDKPIAMLLVPDDFRSQKTSDPRDALVLKKNGLAGGKLEWVHYGKPVIGLETTDRTKERQGELAARFSEIKRDVARACGVKEDSIRLGRSLELQPNGSFECLGVYIGDRFVGGIAAGHKDLQPLEIGSPRCFRDLRTGELKFTTVGLSAAIEETVTLAVENGYVEAKYLVGK